MQYQLSCESIQADLFWFSEDTTRLGFIDIEFNFIRCYFTDTTEELPSSPEMSTPQFLLQTRESPEQLPCRDSLKQLECPRQRMGGVHLQKQMEMVFHNFQSKDIIPISVCNLME